MQLYAIRKQQKLKDLFKGDLKKGMAASISKMSSNGRYTFVCSVSPGTLLSSL